MAACWSAVQGGYGKSLKWVPEAYPPDRPGGARHHPPSASGSTVSIPKTFFPEQDTGVLMGGIQADQSISFLAMRGKLQDFVEDHSRRSGGG
ncbi:hypothetical protein LNP74_17420 [Klebsiella pneumoniae subsp. pneumoniae]|nr:hypothetical protein [Klebsiella pneumoniae subsp. pneumoniae]